MKDLKDIELFKSYLDDMSKCPLIVKNNVYISLDAPNVKYPIFADVMHEAFFKDENDSEAYPKSDEHIELVRKSDDLLEKIVTFDYEE